MRWRRYINLVALLGVLVHAGMVVRHSQVMLGAHLERQDLVAALGVICHGSTQTSVPAQSEQPWNPLPSEQPNSQCPLCAGLVSAFAIAAVVELGTPACFLVSAPQIVRYETRPVEIANVRPPTRGPPVLI